MALREFSYKDKNRQVMVTKEDGLTLEGIDFSYAPQVPDPAIDAFIAKYGNPRPLKEGEDPAAKQELTDEEKAEWQQYMKWYRKYLKSGMSPVKVSVNPPTQP